MGNLAQDFGDLTQAVEKVSFGKNKFPSTKKRFPSTRETLPDTWAEFIFDKGTPIRTSGEVTPEKPGSTTAPSKANK